MPARQSSEKVEVEITIHHQTEKALMVTELGGPRRKAKWIPLSQVEFVVGDKDEPSAIIKLPEWLAIERELV